MLCPSPLAKFIAECLLQVAEGEEIFRGHAENDFVQLMLVKEMQNFTDREAVDIAIICFVDLISSGVHVLG